METLQPVLYETAFFPTVSGKMRKPSPKLRKQYAIFGAFLTVADVAEVGTILTQGASWDDWVTVGVLTIAASTFLLKSAGIIKTYETNYLRITGEAIHFHCNPEQGSHSFFTDLTKVLDFADPAQHIRFEDIARVENQLHDVVVFLKNGKKEKLHIWHLTPDLKHEVQDQVQAICEEKGIPTATSDLAQRMREKEEEKRGQKDV